MRKKQTQNSKKVLKSSNFMTPVLSKETITADQHGSAKCCEKSSIKFCFCLFFQTSLKHYRLRSGGKFQPQKFRHDTHKKVVQVFCGVTFFCFLESLVWWGAFFFLTRFVEFHSVKKKVGEVSWTHGMYQKTILL